MPPELDTFWNMRDDLYVVDGVIVKNTEVVVPPALRKETMQSFQMGENVRVIIPPSLQSEVLLTLHATHQEVSSMNHRARATVYWPGITTDIQQARNKCRHCNRVAPS